MATKRHRDEDGHTGFSPHIKLKAIDNLIVSMACCSYRKGFILSVIVYVR